MFKPTKTNSSVESSKYVANGSRSNLFKKKIALLPQTFVLNTSEFPELFDTNTNTNTNTTNNYMTAIQKERAISNYNEELEPGYIMYKQGNNNEININYGTVNYGNMKQNINNENKLEIKEYDAVDVNNVFIKMIGRWEKYALDYIELYDEDTYNKLYKMNRSFYDEMEKEDEEEDEEEDDLSDEY